MKLFDEIQYVVASGWRLRPEVVSDSKRFRLGPEGYYVPASTYEPFVNRFNPLDDVIPGFALALPSWKPLLRETIEALSEAGIARVIEGGLGGAQPDPKLEMFRKLLLEVDYGDDEFITLSNQSPALSFTFGRLTLEKRSGADDPQFVDYVHFPPPILDSIALTETLYHSHVLGASAVFLSSRFRSELDYRFRKYLSGARQLAEEVPEIATSLKRNAHFGEVSFNVINSVVSSKAITDRSIEDIVRFLTETNESRVKFVSNDLHELDQMVGENVWSASAKEDMRQFVVTRLSNDIAAYDQATRDVWEKFYGQLRESAVRTAAVAAAGAIAAQPANGVIGAVLPGVSGVSLLGRLDSVAERCAETGE